MTIDVNKPVAKVVDNLIGQITIKSGDGGYFDITKYVGCDLYTKKQEDERLSVAVEALQAIVKHFELMGKSISDNSITVRIAKQALEKIGKL